MIPIPREREFEPTTFGDDTLRSLNQITNLWLYTLGQYRCSMIGHPEGLCLLAVRWDGSYAMSDVKLGDSLDTMIERFQILKEGLDDAKARG